MPSPAPKREPAPARGPVACLRRKQHFWEIGRLCGRCGAQPVVLHVPMREKGVYCEACCPACTAIVKT